MLYIKSFLFYAVLTLSKVQTKVIERDEAQEIAPLPGSPQLVENEVSKHHVRRNTNNLENITNYSNISNDVEVFKDKLGPQKEKQEEETEAEGNEEIQPEVDEPKAEEEEEEKEQPEAQADDKAAEIETNAETEAEAETEPAEEPEPEEPKPEEPKPEETPVEPEAEEEKKPEPEAGVEEEKETISNTQTDDSEMPNDEPAKEEENEKENASNAPHAENKPTDILKTKDNDKQQQISCFTCTSNENKNCSIKPTKQVSCPKVNDADIGKHNGCYTLYQAANNMTMRGCVDELAEEGLKYCLTNTKLCNLCYSSGCNDKAASSNTVKLQSNISLLLLLTISSKIIKTFLKL